MNLIEKTRWFLVDRFCTPMTCGDNPDPRDYIAGEAPRVNLPSRISLYDRANKFGFNILKQTKNSCTAYSEVMRAIIENTIQNEELIKIDPEMQWAYQLDSGASTETGDWIQNAKKQFQDHPQGYPQTEYRRLFNKDVYEIKKWLALLRPLNTGIKWEWMSSLKMSNMQYMQETGRYVKGDYSLKSGHACLFTGYDDSTRLFEFIESEKLNRHDKKHPNGMFHISYDDIKDIMSMYMSYDMLN